MDPFVAEIRVFPFNFAPRGWALCDGQLMSISQNTALFSLLGTTYGGDGKSNFGLPNIKGSAVMHPGQGPGLSPHSPGEAGGVTTVDLLTTEMAVHGHTLRGHSQDPADVGTPSPQVCIARSSGGSAYQTNATVSLVSLSPSALSPAGGGLPHNNMQPMQALNFCIALQGVYPPRS